MIMRPIANSYNHWLLNELTIPCAFGVFVILATIGLEQWENAQSHLEHHVHRSP